MLESINHNLGSGALQSQDKSEPTAIRQIFASSELGPLINRSINLSVTSCGLAVAMSAANVRGTGVE